METPESVRVRVWETPPHYYQKQGRWVGGEINLLAQVAAAAGLDLDYRELAWSAALDALAKGEVDVVMAMTPTPERARYACFLGPSRMERTVLVVQDDWLTRPLATLDDLLELPAPIGLRQGYVYSEQFSSRLASDASFARSFRFLPSEADVVALMAEGALSGFLEEKEAAEYLLSQVAGRVGGIHPVQLFSEQPVYFGISHRLAPQVRARLVQGYSGLKASAGSRGGSVYWEGLESTLCEHSLR